MKKKKRRHTENTLVVTRCGGQYRVGEWLVQTIGHKIGSRMYCTTLGI